MAKRNRGPELEAASTKLAAALSDVIRLTVAFELDARDGRKNGRRNKAPAVRLLDLHAVGDRLSITPSAALARVSHGEIPAFKVGRDWRVTEAELDAYIERWRRASKP